MREGPVALSCSVTYCSSRPFSLTECDVACRQLLQCGVSESLQSRGGGQWGYLAQSPVALPELCHSQSVMWPAGNFFSAAFEDHCKAVAGASGGIFGLLGLFIADMVLNFETLTR